MTASAPGGRRAQAARNDEAILTAARSVFVEDPGAPIAAVAERAGVGIAALYRRYTGKEDLLRRLCEAGLARYIGELETALAGEGDPWAAFAGFMVRVVDADLQSLTVRLAGTFTPTDAFRRDAERAFDLTSRLFERTRAAGVLRPGLTMADVPLTLGQLASIRLGDEGRTREVRRRYLALLLDAMRGADRDPAPGPGPEWDELPYEWEPTARRRPVRTGPEGRSPATRADGDRVK